MWCQDKTIRLQLFLSVFIIDHLLYKILRSNLNPLSEQNLPTWMWPHEMFSLVSSTWVMSGPVAGCCAIKVVVVSSAPYRGSSLIIVKCPLVSRQRGAVYGDGLDHAACEHSFHPPEHKINMCYSSDNPLFLPYRPQQ